MQNQLIMENFNYSTKRCWWKCLCLVKFAIICKMKTNKTTGFIYKKVQLLRMKWISTLKDETSIQLSLFKKLCKNADLIETKINEKVCPKILATLDTRTIGSYEAQIFLDVRFFILLHCSRNSNLDSTSIKLLMITAQTKLVIFNWSVYNSKR